MILYTHIWRNAELLCNSHAPIAYSTTDPFESDCPACIEAWDRLIFEKDPTSSPASRMQTRIEALADEEWDRATVGPDGRAKCVIEIERRPEALSSAKKARRQ